MKDLGRENPATEQTLIEDITRAAREGWGKYSVERGNTD